MDIKLPCKFSLPFFRLSFVNNRDKVCFQREDKHKSRYTEEDKPLFSLSLSHACMFCGGGTKEVNSHGSGFEKLDLVIHLFSFATKGRGEDLERSTKRGGGEIKGFRK